MKIETIDIVGLRYAPGGMDRATGVCCLWTVRTLAQRHFADFDPLELPMRDEEVAEAQRRMGESLARWKRVGSAWCAADRVGDLVSGEFEERTWCAIVVDQVGRIACSANAQRGVFLTPVRALIGIRDVYRRDARWS